MDSPEKNRGLSVRMKVWNLKCYDVTKYDHLLYIPCF